MMADKKVKKATSVNPNKPTKPSKAPQSKTIPQKKNKIDK